jgi:hypothetical protein
LKVESKKFIIIISNASFAQDNKPDAKLKVFKFNPLGLITSSLSFGLESFNAEKTRSIVLNCGIRYRKKSNAYFGKKYNELGDRVDQFSNYSGVMLGLERRMYVPTLRLIKNQSTKKLKSNSFGVYFAPAIRFDFNQHHFDTSDYTIIYDNVERKPKSLKLENTGKVNYLSLMPSVNIGFQFSFLQNAYVDAQLGGGLRFQKINELERKLDPSLNDFNNFSPRILIREILLKEGVRPSGSIT